MRVGASFVRYVRESVAAGIEALDDRLLGHRFHRICRLAVWIWPE